MITIPLPNQDKFRRLSLLMHCLTVYQSVTNHQSVRALQALLSELSAPEPCWEDVLIAYHEFFQQLNHGSWAEQVVDLIIHDRNPFSSQASVQGLSGISPELKALVSRDILILQELAELSSGEIKQFVQHHLPVSDSWQMSPGSDFDPLSPKNWPHWEQCAANPYEPSLASWVQQERNKLGQLFCSGQSWTEFIDLLADYYFRMGSGVFSDFIAFRWESRNSVKQLRGIAEPESFDLNTLVGLQTQLAIILENTEHFLSNLPAQNMVLYGNRGTGKSSVIKGLMSKYAASGLRLVELAKTDLADLPMIYELLATESKKFIIFIDDLSFDEGDINYKTLKTLLEGTLQGRPKNILIYTTSNRRHLINEFHSERRENELHIRDGMEEKLSLADRFGITVTFVSPDQEDYLRIVEHLAKLQNLQMDNQELRKMALRWELQHNGRSGRTARQFVDYLAAKLLSSQDKF